jgi:hypothetical protein
VTAVSPAPDQSDGEDEPGLFLTYYLQQVKGYSPVTSGLAFLPMIACILLSSNSSSIVLLPRFGPQAMTTSPGDAGR